MFIRRVFQVQALLRVSVRRVFLDMYFVCWPQCVALLLPRPALPGFGFLLGVGAGQR